jgi:hypothetical protein
VEVNCTEPSPAVSIPCQCTKYFSDYDASTSANDLCILKTEADFFFGSFVASVDLDDGSNSQLGSECTVTGLGEAVNNY